MWYAYYETATGKLLSLGTSDITPGAGITKVAVGATRPDGPWNETTHTFDPKPPKRILTKQKWLSRFTKAELANILGLDFSTANSNVVAFLRYVQLIENIDLDDTLITAGMTQLVNDGLLTASRANEIMVNG